MKDNDKTGRDKWMHFGVCLVVSLFSPLMALGLAIGKEYGDKNATGNHWCWWDMAYDVAGTAVGSVIHYIVLRFLV